MCHGFCPERPYYSRGPTEMSLTEETTAATEDDDRPADREWDNPNSELMTLPEDFTPLARDKWPTRMTLPLNSKQLNLHKW